MTAPAADEGEAPASLAKTPMLLFIRGFGLALVAVGLVLSLHYYLGARLIRDAGIRGGAAATMWFVLGLLFLSIPVGFAAGRIAPRPVALALHWVAHLWLGAFGLLLTTVALADGVTFVLARLFPGTAWGEREALAVVALVAPMLCLGFLTARGKARIERIRVPIQGLGPAFEGLKIAQISDVHIGETLGRRFLERVVAQVNALDADLIAITGDLIDGSVAQLRDEVASLADLKAKRGVFYVTGNHEYYHGGPAWEAELRRLGHTVLHNEHRVLQAGGDSLVVAGITDHDGGHFGPSHESRPDLALKGAPEEVPRVLLAHQPRSARLLQGLRVDLQLSGHTHGGQMFPFMFLVRLQQPVIAGLRTVFGVRVYTSRGTGYWGPPFRLGPRPEITELTLVRA